MGDVPPHAPQAHAHGARVGVGWHQLVGRTAADVHVHAAHHHRVGRGADDIPPAGNVPLLHQVGDVHRRRGAGDARLLRQLLLGDEGVLLNPFENLSFPLGHGLAS